MTELAVLAPVPGRALAMSEVPDPVFAGAMVGPGAAVEPLRESVDAVAPITGTIAKLHPHAFVITTADGAGVLVHLGIDTVQLKGEGFELLADEGDEVEAGTPLVRWHPGDIEAGGRSPVSPVVALDADAEALTDIRTSGEVAIGDALFLWRR
jgi:glucose-specific phosphotransferase system IIA component